MHSEQKRTRNISYFFWAFDFLFLAAAAALIVIAEIFKTQDGVPANLGPHTLRGLVISAMDLDGAILLSALYFSAVLFSIPAYLSSKRRTEKGASTGILAAFNWYLIVVLLATVSVGLAIWFFTLREKSEFLKVWNAQPPQVQALVQDTFQCCGFFNATAAGAFTSPTGFCAAVTNVTAAPCSTPFTNFADTTLNDAFTTVFGFSGIQVGLFFSSLCLLNDRHEVERFRRIDERRGLKGGFV